MTSFEIEEDQYVDVRSLPLKPPQPFVPPGRPVRRPWHPVMWDDSITGVVPPMDTQEDEEVRSPVLSKSKYYRNPGAIALCVTTQVI